MSCRVKHFSFNIIESDGERIMNWKSLIIGIGIGFAGGYAVKEMSAKKASVSAEKVLESVKNLFNQETSISGSWIYMKPEPYEKGYLHHNVYRGGITRSINGEQEQLEFIADAHTGALLDIYSLS